MFTTKYKVKVIKRTEGYVRGLNDISGVEDTVYIGITNTKEEAIKTGETVCIENNNKRKKTLENETLLPHTNQNKLITAVFFYYTIEEIHCL